MRAPYFQATTMPMIDAYIPEGALHADAESLLLQELTNILIKAEGFHPNNPIAQSVSVVFLIRPVAVYVGGALSTQPRYRIVPSVPEGKYSDAAVETLVREITEAIARAEGTNFDEISPRVWIFPTEIPEGRWGARGVVRGIADIQAMLAGEHERQVGDELLATRRRRQAYELIQATAEAVKSSLSSERSSA